MPDAVGATTATTATPNTAKNVVTNGVNPTLGDKNMFLKLLVAQLKYQNPMQPTDPTSFLSQSAQFTMIEKLDQLAATNQASQTNSQLMSSSALIGKRVSWKGENGTELSAVVKSIALDPNKPPVLKLDNDKQIPMSDVTQVASA